MLFVLELAFVDWTKSGPFLRIKPVVITDGASNLIFKT